jgi:cytochrome c oxidase subunit 2
MWIRLRVSSNGLPNNKKRDGQTVFEQQACINCHTVAGTVANGRFGPDLTHLMSRATLAAGATPNTPENLRAWIDDPTIFKPGSLMPAMHLTGRQNDQITAYLLTLK